MCTSWCTAAWVGSDRNLAVIGRTTGSHYQGWLPHPQECWWIIQVQATEKRVFWVIDLLVLIHMQSRCCLPWMAANSLSIAPRIATSRGFLCTKVTLICAAMLWLFWLWLCSDLWDTKWQTAFKKAGSHKCHRIHGRCHRRSLPHKHPVAHPTKPTNHHSIAIRLSMRPPVNEWWSRNVTGKLQG